MYGSQERWGGNLIGFAPTANWWWLVPATSSAGSLLDSPAFCPVSSNWDGLREVLSQVCGLVEMAISEGQGWRETRDEPQVDTACLSAMEQVTPPLRAQFPHQKNENSIPFHQPLSHVLISPKVLCRGDKLFH